MLTDRFSPRDLTIYTCHVQSGVFFSWRNSKWLGWRPSWSAPATPWSLQTTRPTSLASSLENDGRCQILPLYVKQHIMIQHWLGGPLSLEYHWMLMFHHSCIIICFNFSHLCHIKAAPSVHRSERHQLLETKALTTMCGEWSRSC